MTMLAVKLIERQEIDVKKWDDCISRAVNGLPYVLSYFLDNMSPGWSALVAGDYSIVMPLTWRKKWGIAYLYQPAFIQQTGVFSETMISNDQLDIFLRFAKQRFRFAEIFLNHLNQTDAGSPRQNFVLSLADDYENIRTSYKMDLVKNLRAAAKNQLHYAEGDHSVAIQLYKEEYGRRFPHVTTKQYNAFSKACLSASSNNGIVVRSVTDREGRLLSCALLIRDTRRLVLSLSVTTANGRKHHANHFLIDQLIREYAGQSLLLDFEGSDISGIAHFYANFGAVNQPYFFYRYNHLPPLLKLFKP